MKDGLDLGPFYQAEFEIITDELGLTTVLTEDRTEEVSVDGFVKDVSWEIESLEPGQYILLVLDADEWESILLRLARESAEGFVPLDELMEEFE